MDKIGSPTRLVRFQAFEFDRQTLELRKHGLKIKLSGQPMEVLSMLLARPGELIAREELQQRLWPHDTIVEFEHSINAAVNTLRRALGDSADEPRYVETLTRRGYRFIAPLETTAPLSSPAAERRSETAAAEARGTRRMPRRFWTIAVPLMVAIGAGILLVVSVARLRERVSRFVGAVREPPLQIRSLAVLPLENLSGDPGQEYFADGMTDELITELGKVSALRVISRNSVMLYKGKRKSTPEIARELNVDAVVEGAVMHSGERVRITAQLIQARTDRHLWAESYERDGRDVLNLQSEVARAIVEEIRIELTPEERARMASRGAVDPEAYEAYMKGQRALDPRTYDIAIKYFQQAIEKEPNFAMAYAGLAGAYSELGNDELISPQESYPKAKAAAMKALEIDDTLVAPHLTLGWARLRFDWDWTGADSEYRRALQLNPSSADAHSGYGSFLPFLRRFDEARAETKQAQELDPLSSFPYLQMGAIFVMSHQYDEAIEQVRKTIGIFPSEDRRNFSHFLLGLSYRGKGLFKEAIAEHEKNVALFPESPLHLGHLGYTYGLAGKKAQALKVIEQLKEWSKRRYVAPYDIALVYIGLGEKDQAFAWLEKAYQAHSNDMSNLKADPTFDPVRSDPRFQDLLRRMKFPP
jgi:TolB-like protein/DNA-binding winged helix-turn-helix (wHTH) protein/Flp pilus assembly protein TadD